MGQVNVSGSTPCRQELALDAWKVLTWPQPSWLCRGEACTHMKTWQSWSKSDCTARDGQESPAVPGRPKWIEHIPVAGFFPSESDSCPGWSDPSSHTQCVWFPREACTSALWQSRESSPPLKWGQGKEMPRLWLGIKCYTWELCVTYTEPSCVTVYREQL